MAEKIKTNDIVKAEIELRNIILKKSQERSKTIIILMESLNEDTLSSLLGELYDFRTKKLNKELEQYGKTNSISN